MNSLDFGVFAKIVSKKCFEVFAKIISWHFNHYFIESRFADSLKNLILGTELASFSDETTRPHFEKWSGFFVQK